MSTVQVWTTAVPECMKNIKYKGLVIVNKTKSRNAIADVKAVIQSLVGGEIKSMTKLTQKLRNELLEEAKAQAEYLGANAIIGLQLETSTVFEGILDIVLYGTAVYYE